MTEFDAYLALAAYPALVALLPEPVSFSWIRKHGQAALPPDINEKSEKNGRYLWILIYGLLLFFVRFLAGKSIWQTIPIVARNYPHLSPAVSGVGGGILIFGFRRLLSSTSESLASSEANDGTHRGAVTQWLVVFVLGAFAEECWRAFCILAFRQNDYGIIPSDLLTASSFGMAHLAGRFYRIPPTVAGVGSEMAVGALLGALFIWSGNLASAWIASIVYYTLNFYWLRWRYPYSSQSS